MPSPRCCAATGSSAGVRRGASGEVGGPLLSVTLGDSMNPPKSSQPGVHHPWGQSSQAGGPLSLGMGTPIEPGQGEALRWVTRASGVPKPLGDGGWCPQGQSWWLRQWLGKGDGDGGAGMDGSTEVGGSQRHPPAPSKLRKSVSDPARLRTLTGDWFCDVRAQRHRHHLGSDLVRASIRRRRWPRGRRGMGTRGGCQGTGAQPAEVPDVSRSG